MEAARLKKIFAKFFHTPKTSRIIRPAPSAGTPVATVVRWGGDGASVLRLTWLRGRRGRVQGFPCRHYGRCVLDEHIAGEANAERPKSQKQSVSKAERNGRGQKSPDGRALKRLFFFEFGRA